MADNKERLIEMVKLNFKTSLDENIRVEGEVFWLKNVYGDEYSVKEIQ